ncbi:HAMP domain-containing sensor histidine kinase [Kineosporia sp. A_224]|uniref:sensor histidine kinase n=1 Tax=Kineosporia sp. A_224 TaxID=1962180 RepID=UPI000B4B3A99|nr:HAMP domain-containing sensor histidine kinase [Kineosporia sp. A_224]
MSGPPLWEPAPPARGLRGRLVLGFVGVSVVTAVVTGATAVVGALVLFAVAGPQSAAAGRRLRDATGVGELGGSDLVWVLVLAAVLLLAVSAGTGWLFARRVLRPVTRLAAAAERVTQGDLDVRLVPEGDDELARLATRFNTMTVTLGHRVDELGRLEARSRRFAADVSHELRTPLAAMTAVTEVLRDETDGMTPKAAQASRIVVTEIEHLNRLVLDLIEISRFDAGTARLDVGPADVGEAVRACLARRGWADVVVDVPAGLVVPLDRRRFDVVVANLVGNAVRYGEPPVEVRAALAGGALVLDVVDRGPGIAPDALPHVFERFTKADPARSRSEGSGLGLAIALENARLHGGTLTARNRTGGGACFTLTLPTGG